MREKTRIIGRIIYKLLINKAYGKVKNAEKNGFSGYYLDNDKFGRWTKKHRRILTQIKYVISISNPSYTHKYIIKLKDYYPHLKWLPFFYDPIADSSIVKNKKDAIRFEEEIFNRSHHIFLTQEIVQKKVLSPINDYLSKTSYIPTHLLIDKSCSNKKNDCNTIIKFLYSGRIMIPLRDPRKMLDVFFELPQNYTFSFLSKGCEEILDEYQRKMYERFYKYGYVNNHRKYNEIHSNADVLIVVGNNNNNQIPSKIVEYMSFCKPIIYFQSVEDDPAIHRYGLYPLLCIITDSMDAIQAANTIQQFCQNNLDVAVNYEVLQNLFFEDTIQFVSSEVENVIDNTT